MNRYLTSFVLIAALQVCAQAGEHTGSRPAIFGADPDLKAGEVALRDGDHKLAIKKLLAGLPNAISTKDRATTFNNLCAAYSLAGEYDTSIQYCNDALSLKSGYWRAYQNRARSLIGKGEHSQAIESARQGLVIVPESPVLLRTLELAQRLNAKPHVIIDNFSLQEADK